MHPADDPRRHLRVRADGLPIMNEVIGISVLVQEVKQPGDAPDRAVLVKRLVTASRYRPGSTGHPSRPSAVIRAFR